jgi:hypothetical protein
LDVPISESPLQLIQVSVTLAEGESLSSNELRARVLGNDSGRRNNVGPGGIIEIRRFFLRHPRRFGGGRLRFSRSVAPRRAHGCFSARNAADRRHKYLVHPVKYQDRRRIGYIQDRYRWATLRDDIGLILDPTYCVAAESLGSVYPSIPAPETAGSAVPN